MNAPRKTLLIIDDDERLCSLLTTYLSRHGYDLLSAGDGEMGLKLIKDLHPFLVILDLMLPGDSVWA